MGVSRCKGCGSRDCRYGCPEPTWQVPLSDLAEDAPALQPESGDGASKPAVTHYTQLSPEPIDVIEAWNLGFRLGNALKYLARAGRKSADARDDLRKAVTYIEREIAAQEGRRAWK